MSVRPEVSYKCISTCILCLCRKCGHKWQQQFLQNVVISVWIAHVKTVRCPSCRVGWKSLSFVLGKEKESDDAGLHSPDALP